MPANWNLPTLTSNYATGVLQVINEKLVDAVSLFVLDGTNIPENAIKFNRTTLGFQERISGLWSDRTIGVVGGGTGGSTPLAARSNLGLGSLATQNANAVAITGGSLTTLSALDVSGNITFTGVITGNGSGLTGLNASNIASGTIPTARLGSGTANSSVFLRGDSTWQAPSGTVPAAIIAMFDTACPAGWTRFTPLDGRFPKGGATYGITGGSSTHDHGGSTSVAGAHTHGLTGSTGVTSISHAHSFTTNSNTGNGSAFGTAFGGDFNSFNSDHRHVVVGSTDGADSPHSHTVGSLSVGSGGNHSHTITAANHEPPSLTMVFCKKD